MVDGGVLQELATGQLGETVKAFCKSKSPLDLIDGLDWIRLD